MTEEWKFDLQLFAEGEAGAGDNTADTQDTDADMAADDNAGGKAAEENSVPTDGHEADDEHDSIDEALGIDDDTKRAFLEANGLNPNDYSDDKADDEPEQQNDNTADTQEPRQQGEELTYEKELAALKRKYGKAADDDKPMPKAQQQAPKQVQTDNSAANLNAQQFTFNAASVPQLKITPEMIDAVNPLIKQRALQMAGLKEDELDGLEYAEDGERKQQMYNNAVALARNQVMIDLNNRYMQMQEERQRQAYERQQSISAVNSLVEKINATPNHEAVANYATSEYLASLPPMAQQCIKQAYARADKGQSTYADNMILENFWNNGVAAYNAAHNTGTAGRINRNMNIKNKMPRAGQVQNAGAGDPAVWTIDRLQTALDRGEYDKIPASIRKSIMETGQM